MAGSCFSRPRRTALHAFGVDLKEVHSQDLLRMIEKLYPFPPANCFACRKSRNVSIAQTPSSIRRSVPGQASGGSSPGSTKGPGRFAGSGLGRYTLCGEVP